VPQELEALAAKLLQDPVRVSVNAQASTPDRIDQAVCFVEPANKRAALERFLDGLAFAFLAAAPPALPRDATTPTGC
jgi:superfamily II DNA/RNA helicase